jgi:hypothetical protein
MPWPLYFSAEPSCLCMTAQLQNKTAFVSAMELPFLNFKFEFGMRNLLIFGFFMSLARFS